MLALAICGMAILMLIALGFGVREAALHMDTEQKVKELEKKVTTLQVEKGELQVELFWLKQRFSDQLEQDRFEEVKRRQASSGKVRF